MTPRLPPAGSLNEIELRASPDAPGYLNDTPSNSTAYGRSAAEGGPAVSFDSALMLSESSMISLTLSADAEVRVSVMIRLASFTSSVSICAM